MIFCFNGCAEFGCARRRVVPSLQPSSRPLFSFVCRLPSRVESISPPEHISDSANKKNGGGEKPIIDCRFYLIRFSMKDCQRSKLRKMHNNHARISSAFTSIIRVRSETESVRICDMQQLICNKNRIRTHTIFDFE